MRSRERNRHDDERSTRRQGRAVTGAASGIGAACARRFADEGATRRRASTSAVPDDASVRRVRRGRRARRATSSRAAVDGDRRAARADRRVGERGRRVELRHRRHDRRGRVGAACSTSISRARGSSRGRCCRAWSRRGAGSIVNLASVEGIEGGQSQTAYNASKGGVVLLTRSMAVDYGPSNVRVNCLCPGMIQTPMTAPLQDGGLQAGARLVRGAAPARPVRAARRGRGRRALPRLRRRVVRDRPRPRRRRRLPRRPPLPRRPVTPSVIDPACVSSPHTVWSSRRQFEAVQGCWLLTRDDLAGHVRREVGREEHDHVGDLPRLGGAAERLAGRELGEQLLGGDLGEVRRASRATARPR